LNVLVCWSLTPRIKMTQAVLLRLASPLFDPHYSLESCFDVGHN
jgi:hypothetical protein